MSRFERALWLVRSPRGRRHLLYGTQHVWRIWLPLALIFLAEWVFLESIAP